MPRYLVQGTFAGGLNIPVTAERAKSFLAVADGSAVLDPHVWP